MAETYTVLGQKQVMNLNPAGTGFSNDWEITYKVTSGNARGTVAMVTVPDSDHNPKYVDAAIQEKISALHDIAGLGSSQ